MYQQGANLKLRVSESSFDQRSNNVNGQQIVARMFGGLDIIYTDRQTDRHIIYILRRSTATALPGPMGDGEGRRRVCTPF